MDALRIELGADATPTARAELWRSQIPLVFEGLRVVAGAAFGPATLKAHAFGPGRFVTLSGSAHRIERRAIGRDASSSFLNVLLQTSGEAAFLQSGRRGHLSEGDVVLIDGAQSFDLDLGDSYAQTLIQLPRDLIARRHEGLVRHTGERLRGDEPATQIVFDTVRAVAGRIELLAPEQRGYPTEAIVDLLGALAVDRPGSIGERRFARAMADIEANLSNPELAGDHLAELQGISRRRLESIFAERGVSVDRVIWDRRLERVAAVLRDRAQRHLRIVDVALTWGFNSEAHFSRSFRKKFGESPRAYRQRSAAAAGSS